ncbi:hypothetical protein JKF63_07180 [Porcisia hertigi]|uniref:Uncharacterized protein n=1 Tax=Porcisia hertigi TaxID=2761500 RepID=A0A836LKP9_9TRYP|nr:hypothetical protein JKF63_07180 [Porcisia hertigi]
MRTATSSQFFPLRQPPSCRAQHPRSARDSGEAAAFRAVKTAASERLKPSEPRPRVSEAFIEKGRRRRADAERARLARAAEASGGAVSIECNLCGHSNSRTAEASPAADDRADKRLRKMSMMPPPRGYDAYVRRGESRRKEVNRQEEQRRNDDIVKCTHRPKVNRHRNAAVSSLRGSSAVRQASYPPPRPVVAAGKDDASAGDALVTPTAERRTRKTDWRDQRPRHIDKRCTPASTAATSAFSTDAKSTAREKVAAPLRTRAAAQGKATARGATVCSSTAGGTARKKSKAEIEQHLTQMMSREEERRAKWEVHLSLLASERGDAREAHAVRNPKTNELAERARTRYRLQKELATHSMQQKEAQRPAVSATEVPQRWVNWGRAPPSPRTAHAGEQGTEPITTTGLTRIHSGTARDFHAHQLQAEVRKQRRLEQLRLHRIDEELRECTFHPRLKGTSERVAQRFAVKFIKETVRVDPNNRSASATPPWREIVDSDGLAESAPRSPACCGDDDPSPLVDLPDSRLLHELNRASSVSDYGAMSSLERSSPRPAQCRLDDSRKIAFDDGSSQSSTNSLADNMHSVETLSRRRRRRGEGVTKMPPRLSGQLVEQLQDLHEMLHEWKEIKRESSPMPKRSCSAGHVQ